MPQGKVQQSSFVIVYEYINPENPDNLTNSNIAHLALWSEQDWVDDLSSTKYGDPHKGSDDISAHYGNTAITKSVEIKTKGKIENLIDVGLMLVSRVAPAVVVYAIKKGYEGLWLKHGFDIKQPDRIEDAIDSGLITPWPMTLKTKTTDQTTTDQTKTKN